MYKKLSSLLRPGMRMYFIVLIVFAVVTFFIGDRSRYLAFIEIGIIIVLAVYTLARNRRSEKQLKSYMESISENMDASSRDSLTSFPLPVVAFSPSNGHIRWQNSRFLQISGARAHMFESQITDAVPSFSTKWLLEGKNECPDFVEIGDRRFKVYGSIARSEQTGGGREFLATTYWVDMTEFSEIYDEYVSSRPVVAVILLDNYDELLKGMTEKEKSTVLSDIDDRINEWSSACEGYLSKYDRDRYFLIFEERYLQSFIDGKFSILDAVKTISGPNGVPATLSIGMGKDGKTFAETASFAMLSIEMALSRGGDQAVIKNRFNFEFFGGQSTEFEKRTKVKSRVMANAFGELVQDASSIFVMGHKTADLDSIGAAVGVCCIARARGKRAMIVYDAQNNSAERLIERVCTLPEYRGVFVSSQDAILEADSKSLLVVVDTNRPDQVESEELLLSCNRVAVIDHHRRAADYIQNAALNFHEPYASSACELVTELLQYLAEQSSILRFEAEALLSGIVLDTKNFTLRTGSRTFDAAAFLRRAGADTQEVKKLMQSDIGTALSRYTLISSAHIHKDGIAIASSESPVSRIVVAQAADELLNIDGVTASFVLSPDRGEIGISGRSIGDVNVQLILEKLGGGGNKFIAGAQMTGISVDEALRRLTEAIDDYLEYNGRMPDQHTV